MLHNLGGNCTREKSKNQVQRELSFYRSPFWLLQSLCSLSSSLQGFVPSPLLRARCPLQRGAWWCWFASGCPGAASSNVPSCPRGAPLGPLAHGCPESPSSLPGLHLPLLCNPGALQPLVPSGEQCHLFQSCLWYPRLPRNTPLAPLNLSLAASLEQGVPSSISQLLQGLGTQCLEVLVRSRARSACSQPLRECHTLPCMRSCLSL